MNKKVLIALITFIVFLVVIIYIFSLKSVSGNDTARAKALVEKAFPQYSILKQFDTGIHLQGFILEDKKDPNKKTVTFTSEDGFVIVNGELLAWDINQDRVTNLNKLYTKYFITDDRANQLYVAIKQKAAYIQQGDNNAPHKFYAIIDPGCEFCHALFNASQEAIKQKQLAVRWVVVGALDNSKNVANSIYNSEDPLNALLNYENSKIYDKQLSKDTNEKVENNDELIKYITGFPTIVYKNNEDYLRISGGGKLPLTPGKVAEKDNIKKVNEFLLLTSNKF